ncbi:MAG TPA: DUF4383 domain-containing protein [Gemmatimonadaceae bacterium]|nr:DUF4383 domain-containing protein [Gemmatimonadaceae bacterium]
MVRKLAFVFGIVFAIVVAVGYVPDFITSRQGEERTLFDLFAISLLDDITHSLSAIALLAASLHSQRASALALTAFGWYYALDAAFFLTYGFFNDLPYMADIMLNLPHVVTAAIMLGAVYFVPPSAVPVPPHRASPHGA